jgi:hypothetical protein
MLYESLPHASQRWKKERQHHSQCSRIFRSKFDAFAESERRTLSPILFRWSWKVFLITRLAGNKTRKQPPPNYAAQRAKCKAAAQAGLATLCAS